MSNVVRMLHVPLMTDATPRTPSIGTAREGEEMSGAELKSPMTDIARGDALAVEAACPVRVPGGRWQVTAGFLSFWQAAEVKIIASLPVQGQVAVNKPIASGGLQLKHHVTLGGVHPSRP